MSAAVDLHALRDEVAFSVEANVAAQARLAQAKADLARLKQAGTGDLGAGRAELEAATDAASMAAGAVERARRALREAIAAQLGPVDGSAPVASAGVPVALLPVGLETRFGGDTLLIRILPDELHVEDHEPELTEGEVQAGRTFWAQVWRGGSAEPAATDAEREAWARLVAAIGSSRRAAWVADSNAPIGGTRPAAPVSRDAELPDPPVFGEPALRAGAWSRAATARTLPDRFVAIAYRRSGTGGQASWTELARAHGEPVDDSIQLGFEPTAPPPEVTGEGPALPEEMRWMVDPDAAEQAGLLIHLPLPAGTNRVDRLVVLGLLESLDAAGSAARLAELLTGHHHSGGLELLPIGTPTNNTAAQRSGFASPDDAALSFATERRTPAPPPGSDGALLAQALGIPAEVMRGIAHAGDAEQAAAGQMNALVWPAAFGYWFDSLIQPGLDDGKIADIRRHATQAVRARGPLPPLRIGRQPYGVLPATTLRSWRPDGEPPGVVLAAEHLRAALPWWLDGASRAPVVRAGAGPDQGTLDMLGQAPVSNTVAVRSMVGSNVCYLPHGLFANDGPGEEAGRQRWRALLGLRALGHRGFPYIGQLVGAADPVPLLRLPFTVDPRTPPDQAGAAWEGITTYLRGLRGRPTRDLQAENPRGLTSLLTLLARRSVMLERVRAGIADTEGAIAGRLVEAHLRVDHPAVVQAQLLSTTATLRIGEGRSVAGALLAGTVERADGDTVGMVDHLDERLVDGGVDRTRYGAYAETVEAAEAVAGLDPDRAALLLGEALDAASHRFDAWVTSLATRRLSDLRAATPAGVTLGAYGVVEELVRRPVRPSVGQPSEGAPSPLVQDTSGGGYVHAPSLQQAATAAVLRAGHLAHAARDPNAEALAIDLSSSRVRTALALLDGVRQGQPLGALLGYRAERMLHERGAHTAVAAVRALAPPPVVTAQGTPEGLPPRAVCDGLALSRMDRSAVLADVAAGERAAVGEVLEALVDAADAVADLLLAESVHQIVRGNPDRAAGALDTLNRGEGATAEPELVATPRTGTSVTQRALLLLAAETPAAPGWPTSGVRASAEPRLADWAGHMLGDPSGLTVTVRAEEDTTEITLADLQLGALDLVYEPLAPRVLRHARRLGLPEGAVAELGEPRLAAMLAVAETLHGLLSKARAGTGVDLARPQDRGGVVAGPPPLDGPDSGEGPLVTKLPDVDAGDRRTRLDGARDRLDDALADLGRVVVEGPAPAEASVADALDTLACFGLMPGGDPGRPPSAAGLVGLREAGKARLAASLAAQDDPQALFGEGFPVLALAAPPFPAALAAALAADPVAVAPAEVLVPLGGESGALASWLEKYGRARAPLGRLADALLAARLRGVGGPARLRALQQPAEPFPAAESTQRGRWVGLPFPAALGFEPVTSLVAHALGDVDAERGMAVLVVDEFVEVVPAEETTTGVSFGFDAPGARPPQTILLAVPPEPAVDWTFDGLAGVVGETLDLAKVRMVDLSAVAWAGRFIPTIYLTDGDVASGLDLPLKELVQLADLRAKARVDR